MAQCPKCAARLRLIDWKQNCPYCGANVFLYNLQERLMLDADKAEVEHYHFQRKIDRAKASFIGSKLAVARIAASVLLIGAVFLPLVITEPGSANMPKTLDARCIWSWSSAAPPTPPASRNAPTPKTESRKSRKSKKKIQIKRFPAKV